MATRQSGRRSNCINPAHMLTGANKHQTESRSTSPPGALGWSDQRHRAPQLLVLLGILFCIVGGSQAGAQAHPKNVLLLYSFSNDTAFQEAAEPLRSCCAPR